MPAWTLLSLFSPAAACGPIFPVTILTQDESGLSSAPLTSFSHEVTRLFPPKGDITYRSLRTPKASAADLAAAGVSPQAAKAVADIRQKMFGYRPKPVSLDDMPEGLPPEFDLYLRGAITWTNGDVRAARRYWQAVLDLPADQRRYRSTWAAYMLGRSEVRSDPQKTGAWMAQTRSLAAEGYADSLHLAAETFGWEAYTHLQQDDLPAATKLYVRQVETGSPGAVMSLQTVARRALSRSNLYAVAQDPLLNPLITADLVSQRNDDADTTRWLEAVTEFGGGRISGADRLAWAAYQSGDMASAKGWLEQSQPTPIAQWIRAKLLIRDGKFAEAEPLLATVSEGLGDANWGDAVWWERRVEYEDLHPSHIALAEQGALLVQQGRYAEALGALIAAEHWPDAAYVAERLMDLDELARYVDTHTEAAPPDAERFLRTTNLGIGLRDLLGRRLVRDGKPARALPYIHPHTRPHLSAYIDALEAGKKGGRLARAEALWAAARLARQHGMEMMGTELTPDYGYSGGNFTAPSVAAVRLDYLKGALAPTDAERTRARASLPEPDARFHYRYVAADLGWQAAALLPDDDEGTLKLLCQSGSWLKYRDPQAADRYYKSMVNRGWNTALGNEANLLRWFPSPERCAMDGIQLDNPDAIKDGCATVSARGGVWALALSGLLALGRRRESR